MTEIKCTRCKLLKPDDGLRMCDTCRQKSRKQDRKRLREGTIWMSSMKRGKSCTDCTRRFDDDPSRLVWDHLPGTEKVGNISNLAHHGRFAEALEEIKKCELVCTSCHARRGVTRGQIVSGPQGKSICQYSLCGQEFNHQLNLPRKFCSRQCSAADRRKLKVVYWKPPKQQTSRPDWWEGQTVLEGGPPRLQ